jgi:hypothetical protein
VSISSTFSVISEWRKVQSHHQIAEKIELCVQKIFEASFGIWQPVKSSLLSFVRKKAARKYVDEIDALKCDKKLD